MRIDKVLHSYNLDSANCTIEPFGNGLINGTWKVCQKKSNENYLIQKINTSVFNNPFDVASNIRNVTDYISDKYPWYLLIAPIKTITGNDLFFDDNESFYRLFPFVENSHSVDLIDNPLKAYEASRQFALFAKLLSGFDTSLLKTTIPDFHNLTFRYKQFNDALVNGNSERIEKNTELIDFLTNQESIIQIFEEIKQNPSYKIRVMHHDTKISNVLFNSSDKGICIVDLDTVMPGYFISDVGDMLRTYLSPVNEEERDFNKISIRTPIFTAILKGYLSEMEDELSRTEKAHFLYAGKFMIYMQALRFLTDYFNNDIYYGAKYEGHNLVRAQNQIVLLQKFMEKEEELNKIINEVKSFSFS